MTDPENKKSFLSMYEHVSKNRAPDKKKNGHPYPGLGSGEAPRQDDDAVLEENLTQNSLLTDEIDHQILMHREAHFGGDFQVMLDYYEDENHAGIHPDFDIERISYLSDVEKEIGEDIAPLILTGSEAETVGRVRQTYARLKEIYSFEGDKFFFPKLIADLILSEEIEPEKEIEQIVSQGTAIVPELLLILHADDLYDSLFPGYGYAPYLAIICLGKIGDPSAIIPVFETLSKPIQFDEIVVIEALERMGQPAKDFLIKILKSRPLTQDNANAAFALNAFAEDLHVATICFEQLQDQAVQEKPLLRTYILSCCHVLNKSPQREAFISMAENQLLSSELRADMKQVIKEWG